MEAKVYVGSHETGRTADTAGVVHVLRPRGGSSVAGRGCGVKRRELSDLGVSWV